MTTEKAAEIKSPFIRMATEAVANGWCWNIYCPFCGHLPFRYAFLDLAEGIYPGSDEWQMHNWPNSRDHYLKKWGRQPREGLVDNWNLLTEKKLAQLLEDLDIGEMIQNVSFPEFIYILGIGLFYTERVEQSNGKITRSLTEQFLNKISLTDSGKAYVNQRIEKGDPITWKDMPQLEALFREAIGIAPEQLSGVFKFTFKTAVSGFMERYGRRRVIAEMLNQYGKQVALAPHIYAYVIMPSEITLLARVENRYSFCNSFLSHLSASMMVKKESDENLAYIRKHGIWEKSNTIEVDSQKEDIAVQVKRVENIPVDKEYVANAKDWLWSSACKNPLIQVTLGSFSQS